MKSWRTDPVPDRYHENSSQEGDPSRVWGGHCMTRRLLAALFVTATAFVLVARAEPPDLKIPTVKGPDKSAQKPKDDADPKARLEDIPNEQDRLKRQFDELKMSLLRLSQRLENSSRIEDQDKAKVIKEALDQASKF